MAEYHVENFGCRASRSDGESIGAILRHRGLAAARQPADADVVIVNTCSVTAEADRQARAFLRRVRRLNPRARVIVTGCYAQRAPHELVALPEVDAVVGNSHKAKVADLAADYVMAPPDQPMAGFVAASALAPAVFVDDTFAHSELSALPFAAGSQQTRPNLKVQDGCGNRCSFCIIPTTRGHSRSVSIDLALEDVRRFVDLGGQELVLSGINLGRWGRDLVGGRRFEDLVSAILRETALPRLRLSSIEPMDWSPGLLSLYREFATGEDSESAGINAVAGAPTTPGDLLNAERCALNAAFPRLARHTHLPLQSGSDTILRRMHRRYRPWHYAERLAQIRALLPDAAIGADVMIGFPGETDLLFQQSYDFIAAQPFTYLHLFPFSARPGTPAWELHQQHPVPASAVRERMESLRRLIADKSRAFRSRFLGRVLSAVTVEAGPDATTEAVADNFLKITLRETLPANRMVLAVIDGLTPDGLRGSLLPEPVS